MRESVSNQVTRAILAACQQKGSDTNTILMNCGLTTFDLMRSGGRIPARNHYRILCLMQSCLGGLNEAMFSYDIENIHQQFPALIGLCLNQTSARAAIDTFLNYRVVIGSCDEFRVKVGALTTQYEYINLGPTALGSTQALSNFVILYKILGMYQPTPKVVVALAGKPVEHYQLADHFFGTHCRWEQSGNAITIHNSLLDIQPDCHNPQLKRLQTLQIEQMCSDIHACTSFTSVVGDMISHKIREGGMDNEENLLNHICSAMHISRWTLNRKLQNENTHFSAILKNVRMMEAFRMLEDNHRPLQDISELMGFSSQSAFNRFFKANTNMTPLAHRKNRL